MEGYKLNNITAEKLNTLPETIEEITNKINDVSFSVGEDGRCYVTYTNSDGEVTKKLGSSEGTATTAQVLAGATFNSKYTDDSDDYSTGTMANYGALSFDGSSADGNVSMTAGYFLSLEIDYSNAYANGRKEGKVIFKSTDTETNSVTIPDGVTRVCIVCSGQSKSSITITYMGKSSTLGNYHYNETNKTYLGYGYYDNIEVTPNTTYTITISNAQARTLTVIGY